MLGAGAHGARTGALSRGGSPEEVPPGAGGYDCLEGQSAAPLAEGQLCGQIGGNYPEAPLHIQGFRISGYQGLPFP